MRRLLLSRETIRLLQDVELGLVASGFRPAGRPQPQKPAQPPERGDLYGLQTLTNSSPCQPGPFLVLVDVVTTTG